MKFAKFWKKVDLPVGAQWFSGRSVAAVWGASNESERHAELHAQSRLAQLKEFVESGFSAGEYQYWTGYVREEVVEEVKTMHGIVLAVLTRNHYGATILNTERVVFGDIDVAADSSLMQRILQMLGKRRKDKAYFLDLIRDYQLRNPDLAFRVYETFSGLRFVVTSSTFETGESRVGELFVALHVDRMYRRLCVKQECFRARLTPKPWRIGLERPASKFPRAQAEALDEFETWLRKYQAASANSTATRLLQSVGDLPIPAEIQAVLDIHDRHACHASRELA